jgi:hypothetical protein
MMENYDMSFEQFLAVGVETTKQIPGSLIPPNPNFGHYIGAAIVLVVVLLILSVIFYVVYRYRQAKRNQSTSVDEPLVIKIVPPTAPTQETGKSIKNSASYIKETVLEDE